MSKLVNLSTLNHTEVVSVDGVFSSSGAEAVVTARNPDKLKQVVNAIAEYQHFHFISDGSWSLHDLLLSIIHHYARADVWITTYSITQFPASILAGMVDEGKIRQLKVLMDYRAKDRYPAVEQLMSNVSELKLTPIHAKVFIIQNETDSLLIIGSANWTTNRRIEMGIVDKSRTTADKHIEWITKKMKDADPFE
jgi:hypothetical protein